MPERLVKMRSTRRSTNADDYAKLKKPNAKSFLENKSTEDNQNIHLLHYYFFSVFILFLENLNQCLQKFTELDKQN